jgi:hypothetical protein
MEERGTDITLRLTILDSNLIISGGFLPESDALALVFMSLSSFLAIVYLLTF